VIEVATAGDRVVTVPPDGWADAEPRWSPDDAWLMFRRTPLDGTRPSEVWIVAAAGGEPRRLAADVDAARWIP
jgi:Tol biopolymer transport system component